MSLKQQFIPITKKARYHTLGNPESEKLIFVLHGYGQLTEFFIQKFKELLEKGYFIVAPEGLHRYYTEGTSGRVGASWMTRELRELDIAENNEYLEQLASELLKKHPYKSISMLGFSQGGATAARWFSFSSLQVDHLILWACVFPDDVAMDDAALKESNTRKYFLIGEQDQFYPENKQVAIKQKYEDLHFSVISYPGNHAIDPKILSLLSI